MGHKGNPSRGRTADSSNGGTLSAKGEHMVSANLKLQSPSDGAKPAERRESAGAPQTRKSEENIPSSGTTPYGPNVSDKDVGLLLWSSTRRP
jgi:hypothetical protein